MALSEYGGSIWEKWGQHIKVGDPVMFLTTGSPEMFV